MALNEQQERFCQSYILHRNASEAARAAGYSKDHAARQGHRLLQSEEVLERITELEQNLTTDVDVISEIEKQHWSYSLGLEVHRMKKKILQTL